MNTSAPDRGRSNPRGGEPELSGVARSLLLDPIPVNEGDFSPIVDLRRHLTPRGQKKLEQRLALVREIEAGISLREALGRSKLNITERSASGLAACFRKWGVEALVDRRLLVRVPGRNPRTVRTPHVEELVRRALNRENGPEPTRAAAIRHEIAPLLLADGLPVPSTSTIRRILTALRAERAREGRRS